MPSDTEPRIIHPTPIALDEFAAAMAAMGPFEPRPQLAVAVSGGADSLALCLLSDAWAKAQDGSVVGLTVDHGLRPESGQEARQVQIWLEARGIAHALLPWPGKKPAANLEAEARFARYALLGEWCRAHGLLHLLTAHHREDQAETFLLRLSRGSGVDGLSGMAEITYLPGLRVLRPLLGFPKKRLRATLETAGQEWLEDPSNQNPAMVRNRLRQAQGLLAKAGLTPKRLVITTQHAARARRLLEKETACFLACHATISPLGYAALNAQAWQKAEYEIAMRSLAALLASVSGNPYRPRWEKLEGLYRQMMAKTLPQKRITLYGCVIQFSQGGKGGERWRILREAKALALPEPIEAGQKIFWDQRWQVQLSKLSPERSFPSFQLRALGASGLKLLEENNIKAPARIPPAVFRALPSLWEVETLLAVPHMGYHHASAAPLHFSARFRPPKPLAGAVFFSEDAVI